MSKPILVIKFGSASITNKIGELDESIISSIARQVAVLHKTYNMVLVSSGAVAAGKRFIKDYKGTISERKAAASVGNPLLLQIYSRYFSSYDICIGQSLCERMHFSNRDQFLQLKKTFEELWANDIIPIANENDVVSNLELKFSDNDELATLIAVGFGAATLIFSTSVPGVLDSNNLLISKLDLEQKDALNLAHKKKSELGLGGMVTKLTFARLATRMGIAVIIVGLQERDNLLTALSGNTGTFCNAQTCTIPARKKWLASGSLVTGRLQVDTGAAIAIRARQSLLWVGVSQILDKFISGEVIEILDENMCRIALGRARISSEMLLYKNAQVQRNNLEIAHSDDIVVL
jgi:glutamate 5-kinase